MYYYSQQQNVVSNICDFKIKPRFLDQNQVDILWLNVKQGYMLIYTEYKL